MVTTSFNRATEISLDLPTAASGQPLHEEHTIEVTVDAQGRYYLREQALVDPNPDTLRAALAEMANTISHPNDNSTKASINTKLLVMINADGRAPHQSVVTVMDAARQVGLTHLTFVTRQTSGATTIE